MGIDEKRHNVFQQRVVVVLGSAYTSLLFS